MGYLEIVFFLTSLVSFSSQNPFIIKKKKWTLCTLNEYEHLVSKTVKQFKLYEPSKSREHWNKKRKKT